MATNFTSVPILDYSQVSSPESRSAFVKELRYALINVGFLYLSNPPVAGEDIQALIDYVPRLFALPQEEKDKIRMANSQHFLGYSALGRELTKGKTDQREQFDFATEHENRWKPGDPEYLKLWGPSQWPDETLLPGFKATMLRYLNQVEQLSYDFITLLSEAFGLSSDALDVFFDKSPGAMQHRGKVVKYPALDSVNSNQGVGPHYDAGFLTFLLQVSPHPGLQVQNLSGEWIDAPPIPGTFVVNIGKALETVTQGLARATSHRVLSPPRGSTPRYSIPFFQNIRQDIKLSDVRLEFPADVLKLKEARGTTGETDSVNFSEYDRLPSGEVNLIGRIKSHPDVAQRHYPELFKHFFPQGLPEYGSAY
ncbi:Clavaminate synthase-like protein [Gloeophyllum trabeum ATCC 11539]|uniref:Clavaminate synthase-like protein n=1 Tax=Gloeophyllum trabeum (strain ATCC 11539 / FP-39264 / Madison 617) TaxID=670483 RepID=S7Q5P0_GLOTA|nr:Clavaminate synthase-like protein [Gloeophyllum trabeum ATCC 11539]EPQ54797.1 Clavaminate synthase-like protein [Gloeophyllum trabeum ATCC 11539]